MHVRLRDWRVSAIPGGPPPRGRLIEPGFPDCGMQDIGAMGKVSL
jgi:hypothetical protein